MDERISGVLVVFNATNWVVRQSVPIDLTGYELHPVQAEGSDDLVRSSSAGPDWATVPPLTTAVFVRSR